VSLGTREGEREIVGVVGDVKTRRLDAATAPMVYVPHAQYVSDSMTVVVRTGGDPLAVLPLVRTQLGLVDREVALASIRTGDQIVALAVAQQRFRTILMGLFAAVALLLAAVGLYGVTSFAVNQRRAELGLRIALGAEAAAVRWLVLREGLIPVGIGIAAGLAAAVALGRVLAGLLYEISPTDPATLATVSTVLALVAALACYVPARRATRVDPLAAMRG
jgi:putative ABC transport system permease protein